MAPTSVQHGLKNLAEALRKELLKISDTIERYVTEPIREVDQKSLKDLIKSHKVVVIFFTAEWCGPCLTMMDALKDIAVRTASREVAFCKVDIDKSYSLAEHFRVQHIPAVIVMVNGEIKDVIVGSTAREKLENRIKKFLQTQ